jgi:large conductance mechanosensitive channel
MKQKGHSDMGIASEFREFATKGNVVDLAVGVIIGGAFGKIVDSLVKDLIMPVVNLLVGGQIDFSNRYLVLSGTVPAGAALAEAQKTANLLAWGNFLSVSLNFVILALVIFLMVKTINRLRMPATEPAPTPAAPPPAPEDVVLLREIRDALVRR